MSMKRTKRFLAMSSFFVALTILSPANGEDIPADLATKVARLEKENAALKAENQQLRILIGKDASSSSGNAQPAQQSTTENSASKITKEQKETGYWLTISSSKRHNSACRYYKASRGRPCQKDEGIPCKICGG